MNRSPYNPFFALWLVAVASLTVGWSWSAAESGTPKLWQGFERLEIKVEGRDAWVVKPHEAAPGRPWIWRARFFGHEPQVDLALLAKGYHLAYCDVSNLYASPRALAVADAFYRVVTQEHGLA